MSDKGPCNCEQAVELTEALEELALAVARDKFHSAGTPVGGAMTKATFTLEKYKDATIEANELELYKHASQDGTVENCRHCGCEWRCPDCDGKGKP